ncbi:MAG TPA: PAS domain S-box protein [Saprospiraceae bacterium]|nr:PAS domain S-box protein [Saprospiraceae bacterium]
MDLESEDLLKAVVESTVDGIIVINHRGKIQFVNDATLRLFGYAKEELVGHSMNVLLPDSISGHQHDGFLKNYLETGHAKIIGIGREVRGRRKDGSTFPFWLSVNESRVNGKIFFTGLVHDLSVQKKTERALTELTRELEEKVAQRTHELADAVNRLLKINVKLEKEIQEKAAKEIALKNSEEELKIALQKEKHLNEMKSRFLSMASHEFKTPLSAMLSSASILSRYTTTEQQPNRERHIAKIKKMIRQLNDVLNDFLSVERMDGNEINVSPQLIDLQSFVEGVVEQMESILKERQAIVINYATKDKELYQDSNILRIILRNLLSNSIKYSDKGQKIELSVESKADSFIIKVKDYGIGIPANEQPFIFTRFFRSTNASNIQGTGLGLAIVARYVQVLGGKITFQSKEMEGSVFLINLPKNNGR